MGYASSRYYGYRSCKRRGKSHEISVPYETGNLIRHLILASFVLQKKETDYHDFIGILALLLINSTISFLEENNAGNAAAALMARLAPKAKVLRDGKWNEEDASVLVPGDIISIKLGVIIPADARLLQGDPLKIDQVYIPLPF